MTTIPEEFTEDALPEEVKKEPEKDIPLQRSEDYAISGETQKNTQEDLLKNLKKTSLNLSGNSIGGTRRLGKLFCETGIQNISSLDLSHNNITDDDVATIGEFLLRDNKSLTDLNLSHNNIGNTGASFLSVTLRSKSASCHLTSLDISENNITDERTLNLIRTELNPDNSPKNPGKTKLNIEPSVSCTIS